MINHLFAPLASLLFFITFWCGIIALLSKLSGWGALATHYAHSGKPVGDKYSFQSMGMGFVKFFRVNYGSCLTTYISEDALYLKIMPLFKLGHKTLSIPLTEIEVQQSRFLFFKTVEINFKKTNTPTMVTLGRFGKRLLEMKKSH